MLTLCNSSLLCDSSCYYIWQVIPMMYLAETHSQADSVISTWNAVNRLADFQLHHNLHVGTCN